jgi:hypothetical protein
MVGRSIPYASEQGINARLQGIKSLVSSISGKIGAFRSQSIVPFRLQSLLHARDASATKGLSSTRPIRTTPFSAARNSNGEKKLMRTKSCEYQGFNQIRRYDRQRSLLCDGLATRGAPFLNQIPVATVIGPLSAPTRPQHSRGP